MSDEDAAIAAVFFDAMSLTKWGTPAYNNFARAAAERVCWHPPVPDESELLVEARIVIKAAQDRHCAKETDQEDE